MLVIFDDAYTYAQRYVELDMISDMFSMLSDMIWTVICSVHSDIWNFEYIKGLVLDILETS